MATEPRPRRLTKPQRTRAMRVFIRAGGAVAASLGRRLLDRGPVEVVGSPERWFSIVRLRDRELSYTLWLWVDRHDEP